MYGTATGSRGQNQFWTSYLLDVICKLPIQLTFAFFVICFFFFRGMLLCFCAIQLQFGGRGEERRGLSEQLDRTLVTSQRQGKYTTVEQNDSQIGNIPPTIVRRLKRQLPTDLHHIPEED